VQGPDPVGQRALMLVDRTGAGRPLSAERKAYVDVAVSPDGARLATQIAAANDSLWVFEFDQGTLTPLALEAESYQPTWSPDGTRLAFGHFRGGEVPQTYVMPANGIGMPELQHESTRPEDPQSWSRTGTLAFLRREDASADIWVMPMSGDRMSRPFLQTRFDEAEARFSPDGHWLADASNESGRFEVYVRPFPGPGQKKPVSVDGGHFPRWRPDGRELFYKNLNPAEAATDEMTLMAAAVKASTDFSSSRPRALFKSKYVLGGWDVLPDGQHFVFIEEFAQPLTTVTIVQNWFEELKRLVPTD
jgi:Tol biopolymer transport system component